MKIHSALITFIYTALTVLTLSACQHEDATKVIKIGTIAGPETELMETAKQVAEEKYGLTIKIVPFNDYSLPNIALSDGSIDANMFQHQPYLDATINARHVNLTAIGKTFVYPMGIYSQKIKSLKDLPHKAIVVIPNDPSNGARALLLLQKAGIIHLKENVKSSATINDIVSNPKAIQIKEIDAASLARSLSDVSLAVINTNFAVPAGLLPSRDALIQEDENSLYANIIVVKAEQQQALKYKQLVSALHSPAVQAKADKLFKGQAIPAWQDNA